MKKHASVGAEVLTHIPSLHALAPIVRAHHERWDGTGYPDQLKGEGIPFISRLICVVDSYMAIITDRPYQQARTSEEALAELQRCAGTQFDPAVVRAFSELLARNALKAEAFPTSALLSDRLIGV